MKKIFCSILMLLPLFAEAEQEVSVSAVSRAPFNCSNAKAEVLQALELKCELLQQKVHVVQFSECTAAGDDGGYVNYYSVAAVGTCAVISP